MIYLIFTFCQLAATTTTLTDSDCKLLPPECALIQDNVHVFCYLFYGTDNAYNYTLRKLNTRIMMLAQKEIQISGRNNIIQAYWNHQTTNIILEVRIIDLHNIRNGMHSRYNIMTQTLILFHASRSPKNTIQGKKQSCPCIKWLH